MDWIKCSERIPLEDGFYHIVYEATDLTKRRTDKCLFFKGKWIMPPLYCGEIIYWIELPPIPEEE